MKDERVATLTEEFRRDLHVRVFSAIANLGFDDFAWLSDEDLEWVLETGELELSQKEAELGTTKVKLAKLQASGGQKNTKHVESLNKQAAKQQGDVDEFRRRLDGYRDEARARDE